MKIQFQFSKPKRKSIIDKLILWFDCSLCTHVDIVTPDDQLYGARFKSGVQVRPKNYHEFEKRIIISIDVTKKQYEEFWELAYKQIGKPYDWFAIFGFVFNRNWKETNHWFCSELVIYLTQNISDPITKPIPEGINKIDPQTACLMLVERGSWMK